MNDKTALLTIFRTATAWLGLGVLLWSMQTTHANEPKTQNTPDLTGVYLIEKSAYELLPSRDSAVLTAWAKKRYAENQAQLRKKDLSFDLTRDRCASPGAVRMMTLPYAIEFFQEAGQLTLVFEWNHLYRIVNLNEKRKVAPYPLAIGISNGRWEGDTLVVETTDITENTLLDSSGLPHSDQLQVVERLQRLQDGRLQNVMTLHDPKAFTRDWSVTLTYKKTGAKGVEQDICLDRLESGQPAIAGS